VYSAVAAFSGVAPLYAGVSPSSNVLSCNTVPSSFTNLTVYVAIVLLDKEESVDESCPPGSSQAVNAHVNMQLSNNAMSNFFIIYISFFLIIFLNVLRL
jgi:hypothetical protein